MGYTTDFAGTVSFNQPITDELKNFINEFASERHEEMGMPGYWCQWIINDDGELEWDGGEKFYAYDDWLNYLIKHFFEPEGYILNGEITFQGEDADDFGKICVTDNKVELVYGIHCYGLNDFSDADLIGECKKRGLM